ncbi:MAG: ribose 5-phosphate isomerase B [Myxococcales bacterium]|nr:MAG: ribose 5-phosphate isomerase B [Myxococcales bacterium]
MIAVASDHGGFALKEQVKRWLADFKRECLDLGCKDESSVDYPDYAAEMARAIQDGRAERGILICGTGIGMSIAANKFDGIRAALAHDAYTAKMSRLHNDANVLVLGGRVLGPGVAEEIVRVWLETPFEGGRHQKRLDKIGRCCG